MISVSYVGVEALKFVKHTRWEELSDLGAETVFEVRVRFTLDPAVFEFVKVNELLFVAELCKGLLIYKVSDEPLEGIIGRRNLVTIFLF